MKLKSASAVLLFGALLMTGPAYADCAGDTLQDAKRRYENGKTYEAQGKKEQALYAFHAAEGSVCEGENPYELDAAKRAAPLGLELGAAAEKAGDFQKAFHLYEAGGHFALADRAMMQATRAKADDVNAYMQARSHFGNRPSTVSNYAVALKVTGAYTTDPKLVAEVDAMPARMMERTIRTEAAAFDEQYLRDLVQLAQSAPDDTTDTDAVQRTIGAHQAFAEKWKHQDLVKVSLDAIGNLSHWRYNVHDEAFRQAASSRVAQLVELRAGTLRRQYSAAPKLLEAAESYYRILGSEDTRAASEIGSLRAQASKLGDEANAKDRFTLAAAYYDAANQRDKAHAVRERQQQLTMQKMQPAIDNARRQADALAAQFSDPAKVEAMRQQALAAQKSMQEQQARTKAGPDRSRKSAEDLEKELGL